MYLKANVVPRDDFRRREFSLRSDKKMLLFIQITRRSNRWFSISYHYPQQFLYLLYPFALHCDQFTTTTKIVSLSR